MKYNVYGVKKVNYTSKRTNLPVKGVELHCVFKDADVWGNAVSPIYVSENLGVDIIAAIKPGDVVDISYNNRGYVAGVEIVSSSSK